MLKTILGIARKFRLRTPGVKHFFSFATNDLAESKRKKRGKTKFSQLLRIWSYFIKDNSIIYKKGEGEEVPPSGKFCFEK